ncbi:MAG: DUF2569 domain-containing protein [Campylobacteraceae bacterium]|jgi:hypothetical protein|nr:DUF2569 domain-containing protein [Campylobacteraceae bacterium]
MTKEKNLEGLGGWLILVGIGVVLSPIRMAIETCLTYPKLFTNGIWSLLATAGTEVYNPFLAGILIVEIIVNIALVFAWILLAYLFFSKKKIFPKCFIAILLFNLIFIFMDALAVKIAFPYEPMFDAQTSRELVLVGRLIAVLIWAPYMLISKRVKATFVR